MAPKRNFVAPLPVPSHLHDHQKQSRRPRPDDEFVSAHHGLADGGLGGPELWRWAVFRLRDFHRALELGGDALALPGDDFAKDVDDVCDCGGDALVDEG